MTRKLDAIFFDIDDTLFSTTRFAETARRSSIDAMIRHGLRIEAEEAYKELLEVITEFSSNYGNHYDKLLSRLPVAATAGLNRSLLVAAAVVAYHETKFRELATYEDVLEAMQVLAETRLELGIITSGLRIKQAEKIIRLQIARFLNPRGIFITDEVGIGKPNPKLFLRACAVLEIDPQRTMYVGDHPTNDIDPANEVGMISVWNKREGKHIDKRGVTRPDYVIYNFIDLLDILQKDFDFDFGLVV